MNKVLILFFSVSRFDVTQRAKKAKKSGPQSNIFSDQFLHLKNNILDLDFSFLLKHSPSVHNNM